MYIIFVCAYILSMPIFCWHQYSVNTYLLSTSSAMVLGLKLLSAQWNLRGCRWNSVEYKKLKSPPEKYFNKICQRQYFVDAYLLLTPIFCRRLSFDDANILSVPIFCLHQIFCRCLYLLTLIFIRCRDFSRRLYLLNLLLMIVLCINHDYY